MTEGSFGWMKRRDDALAARAKEKRRIKRREYVVIITKGWPAYPGGETRNGP